MRDFFAARRWSARFSSATWLVLMMVAWGAGCGQGGNKQESAPAAIESTARARSGSSLPAGPPHIRATAGTLVPKVTATSGAVTARVVLPSQANGQTHVEDAATGTGIDIAFVGAKNSVAQVVDGYVVYPKGQASGAIYALAEPSGAEDYVAFDARPASPSIAYDVSLGPKVAGLRLVGNQLEMLDAGGTPRLRVAPPSIVGSAGEQVDALLAVEGCAVDTNPAGPWGRTVTPPGAKRCRVRVSWAVDAVSYPALLDPRWQTTGSMSVARQDHNLIYLPLTGKVLAVGGRSSPTSTTGLSSAELYDKNSGTWSATSSMSGGRWSASATLLGSSSNGTTSQKVLIAGGINGSASLTTAQLYNQTAGTWAAAGTLNAARHLHTATLLNDGRVLVCGGMNGSTVLTSAALYNPASGSGSWAATTGPIPPPGWRFGTATLIATANQQLNGKVLLAGGNNGSSTLSSVFLFDPAQSAFSTLASMPSPREGHQAVTLSDGRILFAGGKNGSTYLASSVTFDPSWGPGNWTAAGNMTSARWGHAMNLLPSSVLHLGLVLVSGGSNGTSTLSSTEYWNGTNWATDGVMVAPVQQHASVALGNSILIAGGAINNGSTTVSAAEVYDPSIALGCTSGSQCAAGFCVSGVCCDSTCNGGCGSCNLTGHLGICTPLTSGSVCRALAGPCDAAETCNGSSLACPSDVFQPSTTVCRASAGVCDVAETCTGASVTCPADGFASAATVCRPAAGPCDRAENCTGNGALCPADLKVADGTACNDGNACTRNDICTTGTCGGTAYGCDDGLACTADTCNGDGTCGHTVAAGNCAIDGACYVAGAVNPNNQCQQCTPGTSQTGWTLRSNGTICRAAAGGCDVAEVCDGTSPACPADGFAPTTTVCRASAGPCDVAETCTGTSTACPADTLAPTTTVCRAAAGACDLAETCTGTSAACPGDVLAPATTVCRAAAGPCDVAETCTGASATCPADVLVPATTVCRPSAGPCDVAETCTGINAACPVDVFAPTTTVCRASAGPCDLAETCSGSSANCPPDGFLQASLECRPAAGPCDAVEVCSGTSADCPADAFAPASVICRASTGLCDPAENCTGSAPTCPPDLVSSGPPAPTTLVATATSARVRLTWETSPGATSYNLKRSLTSGGPYATVATPPNSPYVDTDLIDGTVYYYVVTAVGNCGESGQSAEVAITPNAGYCSTLTASFCDDFEDGDDTNPPWTPRQGTQSDDYEVVADGGSKVLKQGGSGASGWRVMTAGRGWTDLTVQAQVKILGFNGDDSDQYVGLFVRYDTTTGAGGYYLALQPGNQFQLRKMQGGGAGSCINATWPNSSCQQQATVTLGVWHTVKLVVQGSTLTAYIDGTKVEEATDGDFQDIGAIGVGSFNGATFEVDNVVVNGPSITNCAAAIVPDPTLSGPAREVKYQDDILRLCTGTDLGPCERVLRARANVDFFSAAGRLIGGTFTPAMYLAVVRDRDRKLLGFRYNEAAACKVVQGDVDGDFVPDDSDQCPNTPDLTPTTDDGCTDSNLPIVAFTGDITAGFGNLGVSGDPRCAGAPTPVIPMPLGAWRYPSNPSVGKAIWLSRDPDSSGCPIYYQIDVVLTDGTPARHVSFHGTDDIPKLDWITKPAGALQFNVKTSDGSDRGAWASYGVFTLKYRARAFNAAGRRSDWSHWYTPGTEDCLAGACSD
jgi:hypothetical protein